MHRLCLLWGHKTVLTEKECWSHGKVDLWPCWRCPYHERQHWMHSIPKMLKVSRPRINLTFRQILRPERWADYWHLLSLQIFHDYCQEPFLTYQCCSLHCLCKAIQGHGHSQDIARLGTQISAWFADTLLHIPCYLSVETAEQTCRWWFGHLMPRMVYGLSIWAAL